MQVAEFTQDLTFRTDHDRRRHRRYAVRPMYSLIRIQTESGELIDGHIHDHVAFLTGATTTLPVG